MHNRLKSLLLITTLILSLLSLNSQKLSFENDLIEVVANQDDKWLAEEIMDHLPKLIDRFQMDIGVYPKFRQEIYLSHDKNDFQDLVATFGGITEHANAFYSRRDSVIYIKSFLEIGNKETFYQILHHEYIHAFIDYHFRDAPLWFHEGMAIHFSKQFTSNMVYSLGLDYLSNEIIPINEMERHYPKEKRKLSSFYGKSAMAVEYLYKQDKLAFSAIFTSNPRFNIAFNQSFAMSLEKFYNNFEKDFKQKIILNVIYTMGTFIGLIFPIIFIWGWIRRAFKRSKLPPQDDNEDDDVIITL